MSFRKRNVGLSGSSRVDGAAASSGQDRLQQPGVRPSPIDGRPTTSTGTASLDNLLCGHSGLALGCSLLIEENGTTDYAGALLKFYAAEGLVQGHHVHVVGLPDHWGRELPGVVGDSEKKQAPVEIEKMKIAWRYEHQGQFGAGNTARDRASPSSQNIQAGSAAPTGFCHAFDLTKRLIHPAESRTKFYQLGSDPSQSPFAPVLEKLKASVSSSPAGTFHRIVVPSLLSPAIYPPSSSEPLHVLQFLHGLRALFAAYPQRITAIISLPTSLYPRTSGLVRWVELLNDGVFQLSPFPHSAEAETPKGPPGTVEDQPQGLFHVHRLPLLHDRGSGVGTSETDWTFTLSRRKFTIKPFNLPPVDGDTDAQQGASPEKQSKKADVEF